MAEAAAGRGGGNGHQGRQRDRPDQVPLPALMSSNPTSLKERGWAEMQ